MGNVAQQLKRSKQILLGIILVHSKGSVIGSMAVSWDLLIMV